MKSIIIGAFIAIGLLTGFTCSKQQPAAEAPAQQEEMAAPQGEPAAAAPAEQAPVEGDTGAEAAPAAPEAEGQTEGASH